MGMPKLKKCVLMGGLKSVKSVRMENAGKLESVKGLKEVMEEERKRREEEERKRREEEERKKREEEARKKREEEERKRREEEEKRKKETEERKRREEADRKTEEEENGKKEEEERKRREEMMALAKSTVSVKCVGDLMSANCYIGVIVIASNCCNDSELSVLDMNRFVNLKELKVGDECFENVNEVKLIGLHQLERVVIGMNSFTKKKNTYGYNPYRHFYMKNCERLRELKIGRYSFKYFSVCKIEGVPSLEVIKIGELNEDSSNFYHASLELKSESQRMK